MSDRMLGDLALVFGTSRAAHLAAGLASLKESSAVSASLWYLVGALLLIATSSRRPAETLFDLRLAQNLRAGRRPEEAEAAAAAGLSADGGSGGLRCFHCGAEVPADASVEAAHATASPDCSVGRLDVALGAVGGGAEAARLLSANSDRSRRALQRLSRELETLSRVIASAESFGYSRGSLTFAATRHFMLNGAQLPDRPGGFIECLHDCEARFGASARIVGLFSVDSLLRLLTPTEIAPSAASAPPAAAPAAAPVASQAAAAPRVAADTRTAAGVPDSGARVGDVGAIDPSSDRCVLCARRCRDRVLLPCAHFCACSVCLADRGRCPTCGSGILATIKAFVT